MSGLDHILIKFTPATVSDALAAYTTALAPLGLKEIMRFGGEGETTPLMVGLGVEGNPFFWLLGAAPSGDNSSGTQANPNVHIAFKAAGRAQVDAFYNAAIEAGFKCNGKPGIRPYHPNYYATFVFDLAGNNIEVVCHAPPA